MLHPSKQERIEELLRNSLLGEELIDTQFHLFSARSSPSRRVSKPRVLCANNVLLAKSSTYLLDLLSSDISPSDPSLVDLAGDHDIPSAARIDEYGYGSDSDLDDCNDPIPDPNPERKKDRSTTKDDDELSDDGSDSASSDMFVMSPEQPKEEELFTTSKERDGSITSSETVVHNTTWKNQAAMRLRSLGSRHIFVKDTAFQTWYTLLNYLYTDQFSFMPLSSATPGGQPRESSTNAGYEPKCSAKSMYRLASKVGLDTLRDEAFSYIRSNLTEHNILRELSCCLVSTHPELLEMELDVLFSHISSSPVVAGFPDLARRIADKKLPHGADIVIGIHTRVLKESRPLPWRPSRSVRFSVPPTSATVEVSDCDAPEVEGDDADEAGPIEAGPRYVVSPPPFDQRNSFTPQMPTTPSQPPAGMPPPFDQWNSFTPQTPTTLPLPPAGMPMPSTSLKRGLKGKKKGSGKSAPVATTASVPISPPPEPFTEFAGLGEERPANACGFPSFS